MSPGIVCQACGRRGETAIESQWFICVDKRFKKTSKDQSVFFRPQVDRRLNFLPAEALDE